MTDSEFTVQWQRLINRFGGKAIDAELGRLAALEVGAMSEPAWRRAVDVWIGSRKHTDPPRMAEFREARAAEEKQRLSQTVSQAMNTLERAADGGLKRFLALNYPGCKTLNEAVAVQVHRNQMERAERGEL